MNFNGFEQLESIGIINTGKLVVDLNLVRSNFLSILPRGGSVLTDLH